MKYIGIDYGIKNIGIAISDDTASIAFPLVTFSTSGSSVEEIALLARKSEVTDLILGESNNFQGKPNDIMKKINIFKSELETAGFNVLFEPEFMTSAEAVHSGGEKHIDASAAAILLQSYLDRKKDHPNIE